MNIEIVERTDYKAGISGSADARFWDVHADGKRRGFIRTGKKFYCFILDDKPGGKDNFDFYYTFEEARLMVVQRLEMTKMERFAFDMERFFWAVKFYWCVAHLRSKEYAGSLLWLFPVVSRQ